MSTRQTRLYRCLACDGGFAIFFPETGKRSNKPLKIVCPLCAESKIEEVDTVRAIGGVIAGKLVEWWRSLPSAED